MALRLWTISRSCAQVTSRSSPVPLPRRTSALGLSSRVYCNAREAPSTAGVGGFAAKLLLTGAATYGVFSLLQGKKGKEVLLRPSEERKPRVVVLGSGWGSLAFVKELELANYDVAVVSPTNYFLFTPLLPSATVGTVQPASLTEPMRKYCTKIGKDGRSHTAAFYEATCTDIDPVNKRVQCKDTSSLVGAVDEFSLDYDILVMAVGATNNTFGTPGVEENCFMVKTIEDAHAIRDRILDNFETACLPGQPKEEQRRLLSFVIVGGGPTGVEFAAELKDFIEEDLMDLYKDVAPLATVRLVQSNAYLLNTYSKKISEIAQASFDKQNIDTIINSRVVEVTASSVKILDKSTEETKTVPCGMCVWSTGVGQTPLAVALAAKLEEQKNRRALVTDGTLRILGAPEIFAIGDCGTVSQEKLIDKFVSLFREGDVDGDEELTLEEFKALAEEVALKFPQMNSYLGSLDAVFKKHDTNNDGVLSLGEFSNLLREADNGLTALPATAQVANQQGTYVAQLLNHDMIQDPTLQSSLLSLSHSLTHTRTRSLYLRSFSLLNLAHTHAHSTRTHTAHARTERQIHADTGHTYTHAGTSAREQGCSSLDAPADRTAAAKAFQYRHMGSLAYVGGSEAVMDLERMQFGGIIAWMMWRSAYFQMQHSLRTQSSLAHDWVHSWLFGRNLTRN